MESTSLMAGLCCYLCQKTYTNPVSLDCGHSFCRLCIDYVLDKYVAFGEYLCPQEGCNKKLRKQPPLPSNLNLLYAVQSHQACQASDCSKEEVYCLYCVQSQVPAVKTCVQCETPLCDQHLESHNKRLNHILIPPTASAMLAYRKCGQHGKLLQYYCSQEAACICELCCLASDHQGHDFMSVTDAFDIEKKKLENFLNELQLREAKIDRRMQSMEEMTGQARQKVNHLRLKITGLFKELNKQLTCLQKAIKDDLYNKLQKISRPELTRRLRKQQEALSGKIGPMVELCGIADPVALLQKVELDKELLRDSLDVKMEASEDVSPSIEDLNEEIIKRTLHRSLAQLVEGVCKLYESHVSENTSADGNNVVIK
ncbi:E3 ubiquitin-protein ligase TRIM8-like [Eleutherodactylus coqui]|uniref:E3 ubiquitin-protein ligase TRIM8-like n=1 Tax=Eleutherodactylus coqui TaxID=57060 RepID=UPI003461A812